MMQNIFSKGLLFLSFVLILVSCGKKKNKNKDAPPDIVEEQRNTRDEIFSDGTFRALLNPLNEKIGRHSGVSTIWIRGNQFYIRVKLNGGVTGIKHLQHIHTSRPCPTKDDDINNDGYVDAEEALLKSGKVLIPLDRDLNEQLSGQEGFPINKRGKYYYSRAVDIQKMLADLRAPADGRNDYLVKLDDADDLNILSRSILIFGVSERVWLPHSVANLGEFSRHNSLPIACGEITRAADQQLESN